MDYLFPGNLEECLAQLKRSGSKIIAGGTDLMVQIADRVLTPDRLLDISRIESLDGIERKGEGIRIVSDMGHHPLS